MKRGESERERGALERVEGPLSLSRSSSSSLLVPISMFENLFGKLDSFVIRPLRARIAFFLYDAYRRADWRCGRKKKNYEYYIPFSSLDDNDGEC